MRTFLRLAVAAYLVGCAASHAHAGGAFFIDDAAIGKPGECQVESWSSHARNGDYFGTSQPACVVQLGIPVEFTTLFAATRADAWVNYAGLQAKVVPLETKLMSVAFTVGYTADVSRGEGSFGFVNVPVTVNLSKLFRINLNAGGIWGERDHFTYGAGFEWDLSSTWSVIGDVYRYTGPGEDTRLEMGLRYTPIKSVDLDFIYGNNIYGENSHWITTGLTVRF